MAATKMGLEDVLKCIEKNKIEFIRFEQTNVYGVPLSRLITARHFRAKAVGGLFFPVNHFVKDPANRIPDGIGYGSDDALCFPDYDTFVILPWVENTARILIEPTYNCAPIEAYPRTLARRQLDHLKELGYSLLTAHEHEYTIVHGDTGKPITEDTYRTNTLRNNEGMKFTYQAMRQLPSVGVDVECGESEYGPGQFEITYRPAFGIRAADNGHTFKIAIKEMAIQHGYQASFMSLPFKGNHGASALHLCHSLWDQDETTPLFYDPNSPNKLSQIGQHWMAGLLAHAPAITILMAPTINCLSIMQRHNYNMSPHVADWGIDDRACAMRLKINGPKGTYIENRLGGGPSNPYITVAATVAAGIDGIKRKLTLPKEKDGSNIQPGTAPIPNNMKDALKAFLGDKVITEALGPHFVKVFEASKVHEMKLEKEALAKGDMDWEHKLLFKYL